MRKPTLLFFGGLALFLAYLYFRGIPGGIFSAGPGTDEVAQVTPEQLKATAAKVQADLPKKVDEFTRLTGFSIEDRTITSRYEVTDPAKLGACPELTRRILDHNCGNPQSRSMLNAHYVYVHQYFDAASSPLCEVRVERAACK